jgi:hypothetical protein
MEKKNWEEIAPFNSIYFFNSGEFCNQDVPQDSIGWDMSDVNG